MGRHFVLRGLLYRGAFCFEGFIVSGGILLWVAFVLGGFLTGGFWFEGFLRRVSNWIPSETYIWSSGVRVDVHF